MINSFFSYLHKYYHLYSSITTIGLM